MKDWLAGMARAAADNAAAQARRIAAMVVLMLAGAVLVIVAVGFATGSIYRAIANALDPVAAGFIVAGFYLLLGLILLLVGARMGRKPRVQPVAVVVEPVPPVEPGPINTATVAASFAYGLARGLLRRRR